MLKRLAKKPLPSRLKQGAYVGCPCCGQMLASSDLVLFPKSGAISRNGYVCLLGPTQFCFVQMLHEAYPDFTTLERIHQRIYAGSNHSEAGLNNISVQAVYMRRALAPLNINIQGKVHYGYRLVLE